MIRDVHHGKACPYCHRQMSRGDARLHPTRDHVIPVSRGGKVKIICCQTCNGIKADMLPGEWIIYMEENPGWWLLTRKERRERNRARLRVRGVPNQHGDYIRLLNRRRVRQGDAPAPPVIVPPELIWS
jgi:hypothetical protein